MRNLVSHAEQAIEDVVNECLSAASGKQSSEQNTIYAKARSDAPGVYIYSKVTTDKTLENSDDDIMLGKIASLGFKIKHGFSYHGIALNIDCDLAAFNAINPCGYAGMQMLRLSDFIAMTDANATNNAESLSYQQVTQKLIDNIAQRHAGLIELRAVATK